MKPLGVALIGCGGIAQSAHLPAMAQLRDHIRLLTVMDVNREAAERVGRQLEVPFTTRLEAALETPGVEAVFITSPEFWHRQAAIAAADRGLHILCEKPMASTLEDADAMIAKARAAGVQLMIGHSRRFTGRYLALRDAVKRGEVGEVRTVRENERRSRPRGAAVSSYWSSSHWTGDPAHSVGAILTNGIHEADLFNWFLEDTPVSVYAEARVTREGGRVPDFISFTVQYREGGLGSSEVNNALPPGYPAFHAFELFGTAGMLTARDPEMRMLEHYDADGAMRNEDAYSHLLHVESAYVREQRAFVTSIREGSPLPVTPQEARLALAVALAADASARSGRPEPVDGAPDPDPPNRQPSVQPPVTAEEGSLA